MTVPSGPEVIVCNLRMTATNPRLLPHCQAPNVVVPLIAPTLCHAPSAADCSAASATQAADHPSAADGASCLPLTTDSRKSRASIVFRSSKPIDRKSVVVG